MTHLHMHCNTIVLIDPDVAVFVSEGNELAKPVLELRESIHIEKEVACDDCHGGDPYAEDADEAMSEDKGYRGAPRFEEIPGRIWIISKRVMKTPGPPWCKAGQ
jgi:hypothetical protein